jgi:uncharacterized protein with GYD domain
MHTNVRVPEARGEGGDEGDEAQASLEGFEDPVANRVRATREHVRQVARRLLEDGAEVVEVYCVRCDPDRAVVAVVEAADAAAGVALEHAVETQGYVAPHTAHVRPPESGGRSP